jgi:adenine nucleotide transporter 17
MSDSLASALAGATGGIASMALTYPLITMSTRSQVSKTEKITQLETAKKIISEEGVPGLYS